MSYKHHTDIDLARTKKEIRHALDTWPGAEYVTIGDYRDQASDSEAIVVFDFNGQRVRVVYDQLCHHRCNLRAVYLTIENLRMTYKRGMGDVLTHTVAQMLALPGSVYIDPYELLGVRPDAPLEACEAMWKYHMKQTHPDRAAPGDVEAAQKRAVELNEAIERIRQDKARQTDG